MVSKKDALIRIRAILYNIRGISNLHTHDAEEIKLLEQEVEDMIRGQIDTYTSNRIQSELYRRRVQNKIAS